jgi:predicted sulfurtransferase
MAIVLRDASVIAALSCAVGLLVNLVHPEAIPFIADQEYQIFAPCPEPGGEVTPVPANDPVLWAQDTFVVDARSRQEFDAWHFRRPIHVPYDYLDPTPAEALRDLADTIAQSRARRVVVYGDGEVPDTGEWLAKELAGHGIKHVLFVQGGAPALRASARSRARR